MMNISNIQTTCTVCSYDSLKTMLDFGYQPPANRFIEGDLSDSKQETHALAFGYCPECETVQLTNRMPVDAIRPRYNWLVYNEPEGHLDNVAAQLLQLPGINKQSNIVGITYKDQSTIDRLAQLGLSRGSCIEENDFGCPSALFGLETIQQALCNSKTISSIKTKYGLANILLMRHVIEHANDAKQLLISLREMIADDGYLVMELPDSEQIIKKGHHAFIWEEHISYFTESSLTSLANSVGASISWFSRYPYPYEDSLVVAFQFKSAAAFPTAINKAIACSHLEEDLQKFSHDFKSKQQSWRDKLMAHRSKEEKIAIFGAGHLATKFINFFNLNDLIDCVIDDHPNKIGMQMPGSLLPIVPSTELVKRGIRICFSTLNPESEIKVRAKLSDYFDKGGVLIPLFNETKHYHE